MTSVWNRTASRKSRTVKDNNRRANDRYGVKFPLRYRAAGSTESCPWKHGHTLNMSSGGLLIAIPEKKPVGSKLELAIDWPGLYFDKPMVRLFLDGLVMRADAKSAALRILSHRFIDICAPVAGSQHRQGDRAVA